jgi:hypothetical protein
MCDAYLAGLTLTSGLTTSCKKRWKGFAKRLVPRFLLRLG